MNTHITRRAAGVRLIATSALLWGVPLPVFGQQNQDPNLRNAIALAIDRGGRLRSTIANGSIPVDPWAHQTIQDDLIARVDLARSFEDSSPADARPYVYIGYEPVYDFVVEASVPLYPSVDDVQNSSMNLECQNQVEREDTQVILGDIFLEAIGIPINQDLFRSFLEQDETLSDSFQNLMQEITTYEWIKAADLIDKILSYFIAGQGLTNLVRFLKRKDANAVIDINKIAGRLILRFIPFVGWLYLGASILLAIKANYHRFSGNDEHAGCRAR